MANCPKCNGQLKKSETMVFCENYKPVKQGNDFVNEGTCEFRIMFKNKVFGTIEPNDVKTLLGGGTVKNKKGDSMVLDLDSDFFTKISFAPKVVEDF